MATQLTAGPDSSKDFILLATFTVQPHTVTVSKVSRLVSPMQQQASNGIGAGRERHTRPKAELKSNPAGVALG
ncbi:hypothetical protein VIGAN_01166700 [Vigna angularis var. angularis]|uniref:Uncharacterized protein n=1 Tax=Vigna angularis var. angularis TaxID=157739 RepID=A0A0S3R0D1_PHAAN|nr:hypothetical protein VIGAN_01166700 [Vigna angularis var. angularis]